MKSAAGAAAVILAMAQPAPACTMPGDLPALRGTILTAMNTERARAGVAPMRPSPALDAAAQAHACDIARRQQLTHRSGAFGGLSSRLRRAGYSFSMANENIAAGQRTPAQAMQSWMGSPGHRANILAPQARDLGVGVAIAANRQPYWVTVGAAPR